MAFAKATLIQRVRDIVGTTEFEDKITADPGTGTTVTVADTTKWDVGAVGEFDDGDQFLVRTITNATQMDVKRSHAGTTAVAHTSGGVIIRDPVYTYKRIVDSIELIMVSLFPWIWVVREVQLTPVTNKVWYNLAADFIDPVEVFQLNDGSGVQQGINNFGTKGSGKTVAWHMRVPAALCASGVGMRFPHGLWDSDNTIYVEYRAKLATTIVTNSYSDISDGTLADCIAYGAASRLLRNREVPRVSQEDIKMGDASVAPGNRYSIAGELWKDHIKLRNTVHDELLRTSAPMKQWER